MKTFTIPAGSVSLNAFFHPAPAGAGRPVLVVCHGFCGSLDGGSARELAAALNKKGMALLRFSFTPQGRLSRQIAEIAAVVDFCRASFGPEIALLGRSMGAAAALAFAAEDRRLAGLCLMASPADLPSTFRGILKDDYNRLEQGETVTVFHAGQPVHLTPEFIHDFDRYQLPGAIRSLEGTPVLIIHGLDDGTVPVENGKALFSAARNPKQLLLLSSHGHSFTGCADRFVPTVVEWLTQTVFLSRL